MTAHEVAVKLERAIRALPAEFEDDGLTIEPPDSEYEADNFGLAKDGVLVAVVQVVLW